MRSLPPSARRRGLATWLTLALCATGCEFFAEVDRGVLDAGNGTGGGGGAASASASSSTGGPPGMCVLPIDCPGADADCTHRTCVDGHCGAGFAAEGTPTSTQISGDCMRSVCDGKGGDHLVVDDGDLPIDGNPCTDDRCAGGVPGNPPTTANTPCDVGKLCDGVAHCVECLLDAQCSGGLTCFDNVCVTCFDKAQDGTETDVDCGGPSCTPCPTSKHCAGPADCQSKVCAAGVCQAPTCGDQTLNGVETDVDCGGTCLTKCAPGKGCLADKDCKGGACAAGKCAPTCTDGVLDGAETDVDCGGVCPAGCAPGQHCAANADCRGGSCGSGACLPTCSDGVKNNAETGADCGGPTCGPCANGLGCAANGDCQSGVCHLGACAAPSCTDGLQNQGETDLDCGGPCPGCPGGGACNVGGDCSSTVCASGHCTAPSCTDGLTNGAETDLDCGGPTCAPCPLGDACLVHGDCQTNSCAAHVCAPPSCSDGAKNASETDIDCGGPSCGPCGAGQGCAVPADCAAPTTCGGGNPGTPNVCGCTADPTAFTCAGVACGPVIDNCGKPVDCGGCAAPSTCGGGTPGTPNVCGCTPDAIAVTCAAVQCGTVANNCGAPVACADTCAAPLTCGGGSPGAANLCGCPLALGCQLNTTFAKRYGGLLDDDGFALSVSPFGLLVGGSTTTTTNFGGGPLTCAGAKDAVVAKLDLAGNHVWSKIWGDSHTQITRALSVDASGNVLAGVDFGGAVDFGGGVITAVGGTDVAVIKLGPGGNHLWSKGFGDPQAQLVRGVGADAAGNVIVAGFFFGTVDFGGGPLTGQGGGDLYLLKFTSAGAPVWSKSFGDVAAQSTSALAVDASGNSVVVGQLAGTVDFGGTMVATAGGGDAFVAAFDPAGVTRWAKAFGDAAAQSGNAVAVDGSGNVVVGGSFKGTINLGGGTLTSTSATTNDAFLAKLDGLGNHLWSVRFGDALDQSVDGVAVDTKGNVLATGSFSGSFDCGTGVVTSAGASDVFVVKYSPAGTCLQARRYGNNDAGAQVGRAVAADAAGNAYVFGDFTGTLDVDLGALTTADTKLDQFLLKLTP
jgi:hypothetical protein